MGKLFIAAWLFTLRIYGLSCGGGIHEPCSILTEGRMVFHGVFLKSLPLMGDEIVRGPLRQTFTWRHEIQVTEGLYGVETGKIVTTYSQAGVQVGTSSLFFPYRFAQGKWTNDQGECWVVSMGFYENLLKYLRESKAANRRSASLRVWARDRRFDQSAKVPVTVRGPVVMTSETDERGIAYFKDLPPGIYTLSIEAAGYRQARSADPVSVAPLSCAFGMIEVEGTLSVSGRVVDPDGKPVNRGLVRLRQQSGEFRNESGFTVRTNADGRYLIDAVPPGSFLLTASPDLCCVYEGQPDAPQRRKLSMGTESKQAVDLIAHRRRVREVRFQLIDPQGLPLANAKVQVIVEESEQSSKDQRYIVTDSEGFAVLQLMDYGSHQIHWSYSPGVQFFSSDPLHLRPEGPSRPIRTPLKQIR